MVGFHRKKNQIFNIFFIIFLATTSPSSTITTSPTRDDVIKPMTVNFQQRPSSTHGPMIYRMTSVNPSMF